MTGGVTSTMPGGPPSAVPAATAFAATAQTARLAIESSVGGFMVNCWKINGQARVAHYSRTTRIVRPWLGAARAHRQFAHVILLSTLVRDVNFAHKPGFLAVIHASAALVPDLYVADCSITRSPIRKRLLAGVTRETELAR